MVPPADTKQPFQIPYRFLVMLVLSCLGHKQENVSLTADGVAMKLPVQVLAHIAKIKHRLTQFLLMKSLFRSCKFLTCTLHNYIFYSIYFFQFWQLLSVAL